MVGRFLKKFYLYCIFIFLYAPIIVLMIFSFNESKSRGHWAGFSLKWYKALFKDENIMLALKNTLLIALLSSVIATVIGTAAAIGIHNMKKAKKTIVMNLTYLPVLNPDIVTGVSLMVLFIFARSFLNFEMGFMTLLISHITFNIPYVIISVMPKLKQLNKYTYEAAIDLGASPATALLKVIVPEIMPGIITGFLMAVTLSIDDFVISFFTTGAGVQNLSIYIYSETRRGINPTINALSTIMFLVVFLLLLLVNKGTSKGEENLRRM